MSREAQVRVALSISKDNLSVRYNHVYTADVNGTARGPSPGAVLIDTDGTSIDFSQLTTPGLVVFKNLSETDYVEYGIWEPATTTFYPLGEILPGESYVLRLSRNLAEQYSNTGTGTTAPTNALRFKANRADVYVDVSAYEA